MSFAVVNDLFRASRSGDSVSVERILSSGIDANACAVLEGGVRQPCFFAVCFVPFHWVLTIVFFT